MGARCSGVISSQEKGSWFWVAGKEFNSSYHKMNTSKIEHNMET